MYIIDRKYIIIDQNRYIHFIEMYGNAYPDLQKKKKEYRSGQELRLNVKKSQDIYKC